MTRGRRVERATSHVLLLLAGCVQACSLGMAAVPADAGVPSPPKDGPARSRLPPVPDDRLAAVPSSKRVLWDVLLDKEVIGLAGTDLIALRSPARGQGRFFRLAGATGKLTALGRAPQGFVPSVAGVTGQLVCGETDDGLYRCVDFVTGRSRIAFKHPRWAPAGVASTAETVVVVLQGDRWSKRPTTLRAFDRRTGAARWELPLVEAAREGTRVLTDGVRVFISDLTGTWGIDIDRGAILWSWFKPHPCRAIRGARCDEVSLQGGRLAVAESEQSIALLDAATGHPVQSAVTLPAGSDGCAPSVVLMEGQLLLSPVAPWRRGVAAVSTGSGVVRWEHDFRGCVTHIEVRGADVYVETDDGVAREYDADGQLLWKFGADSVVLLPEGSRPALVASARGEHAWGLVQEPGPPLEPVRIQGSYAVHRNGHGWCFDDSHPDLLLPRVGDGVAQSADGHHYEATVRFDGGRIRVGDAASVLLRPGVTSWAKDTTVELDCSFNPD